MSKSGASGLSAPPASNITGILEEEANLANITLTVSGISLCSSTAPADWMAAVTSSVICHSSDVLAPPTRMMEFSPPGWSMIKAMPEGPSKE